LLLVFAISVGVVTAGANASGARPAGRDSKSGPRHHKDAHKTKKQQGGGGVLADGFVRGSGIEFAAVLHTPEPVYLHNVSIHPGKTSSSDGTYCLALASGISSFGAIVTVGSADLPFPTSESALPYVTWLPEASDCMSRKQLEIQTFTYAVKEGTLTMTPSKDVSFSFVVSR
jgi:hypothetical protein